VSAPLTRVSGPAAALLQPNINTDIISPVVRRVGTGQLAAATDGAARVFGPWRYDEAGVERPNFVLNRPPFRSARFLIAGPNFGCGSSRETAVLWLAAFGVRCVVAPSFGPIFYDNCFRNGVLPLVVDEPMAAWLGAASETGAPFLLDLPDNRLVAPNGIELEIVLPAFRRALLVTGEDEVSITLARADEIDLYQAGARRDRPWIWPPA
jgi:3-isopropylmalate/(R)-2-methylmalate dehydratase small subunit